jgi:hypothetical protein
LSALERRGHPAPPGFIDQLVFAAPDVGLGDFELLEPDAARLASHVTVYASTGDVAVEASYFVHDYQHRAGNNPKELRAWRAQSKATLDVIDASETNGDVYGHGYLTRSQMASVDIARVLRGETIDQRSARKAHGRRRYRVLTRGMAARRVAKPRWKSPTAWCPTPALKAGGRGLRSGFGSNRDQKPVARERLTVKHFFFVCNDTTFVAMATASRQFGWLYRASATGSASRGLRAWCGGSRSGGSI